MASFRCYDNSDVIATLIITNFHLYLIQLWCQFFPNLFLWRRSLRSNLGGIDPEKLYRATSRCFDTVFQRPYRYFSIALKVFFSLSDRYKIVTSNWLWIEICENVVFSKTDITMTTIIKKL